MPSYPLGFAAPLLALAACHMPALPEETPPDEDGLLLHHVRLYSAKGSQLELFGEFAEVRFCAEKRLLKSQQAHIFWLAEALSFRATRLNAHLDSQEAWASLGWQFETEDNAFGEGSSAYGYADKEGALHAQTEAPLRLWQEGNVLEAEGATCEEKTRSCAFLGAVKTTLSKAP